jgi:hypothetical protein
MGRALAIGAMSRANRAMTTKTRQTRGMRNMAVILSIETRLPARVRHRESAEITVLKRYGSN